jgi:hypothetical protein
MIFGRLRKLLAYWKWRCRPSELPLGVDGLNGANDVGGLKAFRALGEVELHSFSLIQAAISILLDSREMYEDILAGGALDESVTFGAVKPLDSTFLSHNNSFPLFILESPLLRGRSERDPERARPGTSQRCRETRVAACSQRFRNEKGPATYALANTAVRSSASSWSPCHA